ncbi:MAG: hypothetical protein NW224_05355 [Leptolyngbyaceae cyanobacterium bins.302]|nr:hypothetical protein [Leptolyngbyaceae cyanobacterium bins.302]
MQSLFQLTFDNGATARGVSLSEDSEISSALQQLGFTTARPTLVIVGGASGLAVDDMEQLRSLFQNVLCSFADSFDFAVIDGGTDAGVMRLIGQSRSATGRKFPLLGVVVQAKAILPNTPAPTDDAATLEAHHTHFMLVPGSKWGDESDWIAKVATVLSNGKPSLTLLINGGEIALRQDVPNSIEQARPVLIISGSGRSADRLADAINGKTSDPEVQNLINSGLLYTVDLTVEQNLLQAALQKVLLAAHSS